MNILTINTAGAKAGIGLIKENQFFKKEFDSSAKHSESVMVGIDEILRENNIPLSKLDGVAVVVGPGSFTGIRIGISILKGFEVVFPNLKKIEMTSFELMAKKFLNINKPNKNFVCVMDALSSKLYVQGFSPEGEGFEPQVVESLENYKDFIKVGLEGEKLESMDCFVEFEVETMLEIAKQKFEKGEFVEEVMPLYLRKSQAEESQEKENKMFKIEKMQEKHLEQVFLISQNQFKNTSWSYNQFLEELKYPHKISFVCLLNEKVVGFLNLSVIDEEICILNLAVDENFKKQKIGSLFIEKTIEIAKEKGINKLTLEVETQNFPALKLYEKFGFKRVRERKSYYSNGQNCYELELVLKD